MLPNSNVYLEINNTTKKCRVVDATDYASENIDLASLSAKGLGVLTAPTGVAIYNGSTVGSPLVNLASTTTSAWFDLPLDSTGAILNGTYSFTYNLRFAVSGGNIDDITAPSTVTLEFVHAGAVLQAGDSVVFVGNADSADNGTFTVATATYSEGSDNSTLVFTQTTLVTAGTPTGTYSFDVTRSAFAGSSYTWNGCDMVTPSVTTTVDCDSSQYGQLIVQDTTNYGSQELVDRLITVYYPNGLVPAPTTDPLTTTLVSLTVNAIATGTWTYSLESDMSVTQTDGLVYTYTVSTTAEFVVSCAGTLCGLTPCIESIKDDYYASYVKGQSSGLEPLILMITQLYILAKEYKTCGNVEMYAATVAQLESVLDNSGKCSCGCCEETDSPQWINNAGFEAQSVLDDLYDQVQALVTSTSYGTTTLFLGKQFYGFDDSFDNTPLSFDDIDSITIPTGYLDFPTVDGDFGSKAIELDLWAETLSTGGEAYAALTNGSGTVFLAQGFGVTDEAVSLKVNVILRVQKVGSDNLLWAVMNQQYINKATGAADAMAINANYTNAIALGDDLVFNFKPQLSGAAAKTTYTYLKLSALKTLI